MLEPWQCASFSPQKSESERNNEPSRNGESPTAYLQLVQEWQARSQKLVLRLRRKAVPYNSRKKSVTACSEAET